jgi:hypothetical protein
MRPSVFLFGIAFALTQIFPSFAHAQRADKVPSVGVLSNAPLTSAHYEAFRHALLDLGYIEGKNITFIPKSAQETPILSGRRSAPRLPHAEQMNLGCLHRFHWLFSPISSQIRLAFCQDQASREAARPRVFQNREA